MATKLKTDVRMMHYQIENIHKDTEIVRRSQIEMLEFKSTIFYSKFTRVAQQQILVGEERISEHRDRFIEIIQSK